MKPILISVLVFIGCDAIWLLSTSRFYQAALPPIMAPHPLWWAAVLFYILYLTGLVWFCVLPGLKDPWQWAAARGALFGLVAYATYDLTNQATIAGWPVGITLIDLAWGSFLSALACLAGWWVST